MNISTYSSYKNIVPSDIKNKSVVCIDVFCSCTTLIGAFSNGLTRALVVDDPIEAPDMKRSLNSDRILMGGANRYEAIAGLDVSDSFLDYDEDTVNGKELIYSNENFAPAMKKCADAKRLFLGAIVNSRAVARKLVEQKNDIALVCCGDNANFTLEDGLAAGAIIEDIMFFDNKTTLSEYSFVIDSIYKLYKTDMLEVLKQSKAYNEIIKLGLYDDVSLALDKDRFDFVPTLYDNWITVLD